VGFVMAHSIVVGTDTGMGTYLLKKGWWFGPTCNWDVKKNSELDSNI
jgi:hypothetical protein